MFKLSNAGWKLVSLLVILLIAIIVGLVNK